MSNTTPAANQSAATDRGIVDVTTEFVETVTDALDNIGADDEIVSEVRQAGDQLVERVDGLETRAGAAAAEREDLGNRVGELEDELEDDRDRAARERAQLRGRVTEVESSVDDGNQPDGSDDDPDVIDANAGGDQTSDQPGVPTAETPLGQCVRLPEAVAKSELSQNQRRARAVAADVIDYARSVPAGYALGASELRTVLSALDDGEGRTYTETVRRVRRFLSDLGGGEVEVTETRGGDNAVVFSDEFVRRTVAWRQCPDGNGVVAGEGVSG